MRCRLFVFAGAIGCQLLPTTIQAQTAVEATLGNASCSELWQLRNVIFKDAGYCFQTDRAQREFGNAGCRHSNLSDVPLSERQKSAINAIRTKEAALSCGGEPAQQSASVEAPRATASLWNHNGSVLELQANGAERVFRYKEPRPGIRDQGVEPGTVLFQGQRNGEIYSGMAFIFSRRCGAKPYKVSGQIGDDQRRFALVGQAPTGLDGNCAATGTRTDQLDFELVASSKVSPANTVAVSDQRKTESQPPRLATAPRNPMVPRELLLPVVHAVLGDAGITEYKILAPAANDAAMVSWVYADGGYADLQALPPKSGAKIEDVANISISRSAEACKGEFASARGQSRFHMGNEILKVETRCLAASGATAVTYSVVELPSGVLLRFSHWTAGEPTPSEPKAERSLRVENAALKYISSTKSGLDR